MGELLVDEILAFLDQSNISKKNIRRLEKLSSEEIEEVALLADLVLRIAQVHPRRRKRWPLLKQRHGELFHLAVEAGMVDWLEPEQLDAHDHDVFDEECFDGWIEPRPSDVEPTADEFRAAEAAFAS